MSTKTEKRFMKATEIRVAKGEDGKPTKITGYAAVFNSPSGLLGEGRNKFIERIKPGAFKRAIQEGQDVRALFNHNPDCILARTKNGTLTLTEDDRGLRFEASLNQNDPEAMSTAAKVERGDVDGCSFAFATRADEWGVEDGRAVRDLTDVDLFDVGPVVYPAYDATTVDVRSIKQAIAKIPAEKRATIQYEDNSLVYYCRYAVQECRDAFDMLNGVLDCSARITGTLSDQDMEAAEDLVSTLVDLIAKARKTKATLQNLGAEDEVEEDPDDDEPLEPATAAADTAGEARNVAAGETSVPAKLRSYLSRARLVELAQH
jgi:HK97 family phage prohead protease